MIWSVLLLLLVALAFWRTLLWRPRTLPGVDRRRPWLVGHRGVRGTIPENTIAAFRAALEAGLDGVECDVQQTADGQLVLYHDEWLEDLVVADAPFAELRARQPTLPRLSELLELALDHPGTLLNLELKLYRAGGRGIERRLAAEVRSFGLADRVLVSSFAPQALARLWLRAPELRVGLLYAPKLPALLRDARLAGWLHVDALHPHYSQVDDRLLRRARRRGLMVNAWTVNDAAEVKRLVAAGVDGIIADEPEQMKAAVGR